MLPVDFTNTLLAARDATAQFWSHTLARHEVGVCWVGTFFCPSLPNRRHLSCRVQIRCFRLFTESHWSYISLKRFTALVTLPLPLISYFSPEAWPRWFHSVTWFFMLSLVFNLFSPFCFWPSFFSLKAGYESNFHPTYTLPNSLPLPLGSPVSSSLPVCTLCTRSYYRILNWSGYNGTKWSRKGIKIVAE